MCSLDIWVCRRSLMGISGSRQMTNLAISAEETHIVYSSGLHLWLRTLNSLIRARVWQQTSANYSINSPRMRFGLASRGTLAASPRC
jgi:hypothetical protein